MWRLVQELASSIPPIRSAHAMEFIKFVPLLCILVCRFAIRKISMTTTILNFYSCHAPDLIDNTLYHSQTRSFEAIRCCCRPFVQRLRFTCHALPRICNGLACLTDFIEKGRAAAYHRQFATDRNHSSFQSSDFRVQSSSLIGDDRCCGLGFEMAAFVLLMVRNISAICLLQ